MERVVLLGAGPLTSEIGVPPFIRLLRTPLGRLITRIPENPRMVARQLAGLGHTTGGGHMPWYDDPGRVGARVARFLDG